MTGLDAAAAHTGIDRGNLSNMGAGRRPFAAWVLVAVEELADMKRQAPAPAEQTRTSLMKHLREALALLGER